MPIPSGSLAPKPEEKKSAVPTKTTIVPKLCKPVGISLSQKMPATNTRMGVKLMQNEAVVAGKNFSPQKMHRCRSYKR